MIVPNTLIRSGKFFLAKRPIQRFNTPSMSSWGWRLRISWTTSNKVQSLWKRSASSEAERLWISAFLRAMRRVETSCLKVLGKNPNPLNVYEWIKINDYQAIAILWKQKIQQAPHKHNHIRTPNLTWKTL